MIDFIMDDSLFRQSDDCLSAYFERFVASPRVNLFCSQDRSNVPNGYGAYGIFWNGEITYCGKAEGGSTNGGLFTRSLDHCMKLKASMLRDDHFEFAWVETTPFMHAAVESYLINFYRPVWNGSGFGNKAKGKNRSGQKLSPWEVQYLREIEVDHFPGC